MVLQSDRPLMREPAVAGMFYPATERALKKELSSCFKRGPGREKTAKGKKVLGLVSPHAGYTYSGPTAAFGYLAAADGGLPETAVIIGPNHTGLGREIGISMEDFRTPLGVMKNDNELAKAMDGMYDELSHLREHSMEVQMPFLQFFEPKVRQVCISMAHPRQRGNGGNEEDDHLHQAREVSEMVSKAVKETRRDVLLVASSDFTHCGPNYGYQVPSGIDAGYFARSRDEPVIERLLANDLKGALKRKSELGTTACGMGPILAMMMTVSALGQHYPRLLDYRTSYDVSPSHSAVGYASIALYRK
jgi:AmmeMemoRadiSam system protein B